MKYLPIKIDPCPLAETVFEVRYRSEYPIDAIFGVLYSSLKSFFGGSKPQVLPILQLPEAIRSQDQNLKYQPYHRLKKENLTLSIGPRVITFSNVNTYVGWEKWSDFFKDNISTIEKTDILNHVERIGLRYINIFDYEILDKLNLEIQLNKNKLQSESTNLRTEILDSGFIKVLQIGNLVNIAVNNQNKVGSVIDIDCLNNVDCTGKDFFQNYEKIVETAHRKEKELFFNLLSESFLKSFNPIYERNYDNKLQNKK